MTTDCFLANLDLANLTSLLHDYGPKIFFSLDAVSTRGHELYWRGNCREMERNLGESFIARERCLSVEGARSFRGCLLLMLIYITYVVENKIRKLEINSFVLDFIMCTYEHSQ